MDDKDIELGSVYWWQGMLLSPEHFERQERYFDSALLWLMRYAGDAYGLVGGGPRAGRDAAAYDPSIEVFEEGEVLKVSVRQCRGITPAGDLIEAPQALHGEFSKADLPATEDIGIYVVCQPHDKLRDDSVPDPANPQAAATTRRPHYRVKWNINAAEAQHSLLLCRLQRTARGGYEKLTEFIPMCTTLSGHTALKRVWEELRGQLAGLANRYTQLHKAIAAYLGMAEPRQLATREDHEALQFAGRMVMALEQGSFETHDPLQAPRRFFQQLYHVVRGAAVYLELSPTTQEYFRQLAEVGVAEFDALLQEERRTLAEGRAWTLHDDLRLDAQRLAAALGRLRRLEEALEGKYVDYRMSEVLDALGFFFDRAHGKETLYYGVARPVRPQLFEDELTFVIAPHQLEERLSYRLVLMRETDGRAFTVGEEIETEIQINAGAGQGFDTLYRTAVVDTPGQRNVAIDLDRLPDALRVKDLRVTINKRWPVRSCRLYVRRFLRQPAGVPPPPQPPLIVPHPAPEPVRAAADERRRPSPGYTPAENPEPSFDRPSQRRGGRLSPLDEPPDQGPERPTKKRRLD